jgi:hypothetical protein
MAREPRISTQTAILLGSVIIALGLYLGLRRAPEPPPPPSVPAAAPADRSQVQRQVEATLAQHRKMLADRCLAPSLAKKPEPRTVKYSLNYTFDASGKQIARGVTDNRENGRPDVTQCVLENLPMIEVSPPGQSTPLDVTLELP